MSDVQHAINCIEQGRHAEAVSVLEAVTQRLPAYVFAHVLLARTYAAEGRWEEALATWRRARFLMPSSPAIEAGLQHSLTATLEPAVAADEGPAEVAAPDEKPPDEVLPAPAGEATAGPERERPEEEEAPEREPASEFAPPGADAEEEPDVDEDELDIDEDEFLEIERLIDEKLRAEGLEEVTEEGDAEEASTLASGRGVSADAIDEEDDLDQLIQSLESARIEPRPDLEDLPAPELDQEIEDMVSETLARIYASQDKYEEAAHVYEQLAIQQPDRSIAFLQKAAEMRSLADGGDA